ncbi:MAG: alpha-N-acetylglucosaminidase [Coprobacter sp.]|nr:alpha-N-acetylglucosaminidase [Coprobacter sp.]
MKRISSTILALLFCIGIINAGDKSAMRGLISRLLPEYSNYFEIKKIKSDSDCFELWSEGDKVVIAGNNANSMAVGLNHYLKYYCKTEVSWFDYNPIEMPEVLPIVDKKVHIEARVQNRFFLNYCTFGYTMPWWKWREWEHFIDWMALNGVNLPLAITGQESIWYKVWTELGLSDEEVRNYFTGPAHLPWHRMLNIDYWHGNLPMSWLDGQEELQKKIVARERELNMRPVLPAFAGHVPQELARIYPEAKITRLGAWAGYANEYACSFLDPMDPLFRKIEQAFLKQQKKLYGTDHIYGIDLFNELTPPSWEPDYLARVSRQVYENLRSVDKDATWLQMGWLFFNDRKDWTDERVKAYLTSYPQEHQMLLDYYCEAQEVWQRTEKFFGSPYIWCYLGNFGGNSRLCGKIDVINERIENTFVNGGDNFSGIGSTLEGFDLNPFVYEYVFEKAWDFDTHKNISQWVDCLADQRVGKIDENARKAWQLLIDSVYTDQTTPGQCSWLNVRPTLGKARTYYSSTWFSCKNRNLLATLDLLLSVDSKRATHEFDIVNITRQMLSNHFDIVRARYDKAYADKDFTAMKEAETILRDILTDTERLLATNTTFLMGKWIADARSWGTTDTEKTYFESNARNLLTTWGDEDMLLNDYASRTWAGLVKSYYGVRWNRFFDAVNEAVAAGAEFDDTRFEAYKKEITRYEKRWWNEQIDTFSATPTGDGISIAREIIEKYRSQIEK